MRRSFLAVLGSLSLALVPAQGDTTNAAPDFKEVYELVRAHLAGATESELNQAAVEGFIAALRGKVAIVETGQPKPASEPALAATNLLEGNIAYVRLAGLDETLSAQLAETLARWSASNSPAGLVLDLRFAGSDDYAAAAAVADLFQTKARPLLDWGKGAVRSKEKSDAVRMPIAVLVNRETGGAAEALAAVLRETGVGLLLGNATAGRALIGQEFPLKDGRRLRVAMVPVKIGDGVELNTRGVQPDITVATSAAEERLLLDDPYGSSIKFAGTNSTDQLASNGSGLTNRAARRPRPNEADLVRARRDGVNLDEGFLDARSSEPAKPLIRDPVLARAVDLIKGLAVVRATKS